MIYTLHISKKGGLKMDLSKFSTSELVDELAKREGVEKIPVAPYEACTITVGNKKMNDDGGPAVILRIVD